jgi:hypothetical protein
MIFLPTCFGSQLPSSGSDIRSLHGLEPNDAIVFVNITQFMASLDMKIMLIKIQPDATVCRYLFCAKSLYMFQVSQHPSSGALKTAASGTGHNTGTATSLLIRPQREVAVPVLRPVPMVAASFVV